jgi:SAM-dependent methyltransferase
MSCNDIYARGRRLWGSNPSELALIAVAYIKDHPLRARRGRIVDIGCGYGRNSFYLSDQLRQPVLGIDVSSLAIDEALDAGGRPGGDVVFQCRGFMDVEDERFDILFASNFYHVLRPKDRETFRRKIPDLMHEESLLFLNTMSVRDEEEFGKGEPVEGESNSFVGEKYLHFSTRSELLDEFGFLEVLELFEHSYAEPHLDSTHNHTSWVLIGGRRSAGGPDRI